MAATHTAVFFLFALSMSLSSRCPGPGYGYVPPISDTYVITAITAVVVRRWAPSLTVFFPSFYGAFLEGSIDRNIFRDYIVNRRSFISCCLALEQVCYLLVGNQLFSVLQRALSAFLAFTIHGCNCNVCSLLPSLSKFSCSVLNVGRSELCPWNTASLTSDQLLLQCPLRDTLRKTAWLEHLPLTEKLHGDLAAFVRGVGVSVQPWSSRNKKKFDSQETHNEAGSWTRTKWRKNYKEEEEAQTFPRWEDATTEL